MTLVHLGRLKPSRKAAGQMDLLTVPSGDSVDSKVIQVEEALSHISLLSRPLSKAISITSKADFVWTSCGD